MIKDTLDKNVEREIKENPQRNVSIVTLRDKENHILLVRTKKLPDHWQPIGGGVDSGEQPIDAVLRELYEETDLKFNYSDLLKIIEVPYDFGDGTVYCYDTNRIITNDMLKIDITEIEEYKWFSLKEAKLLQMFSATRTFIDTLINEDDQ